MSNNFGFEEAAEDIPSAPRKLGLDGLKRSRQSAISPEKKVELRKTAESLGFPARPSVIHTTTDALPAGKSPRRVIPREKKRGICVHGPVSIIDRFTVFTNNNKCESYAEALKVLMDCYELSNPSR